MRPWLARLRRRGPSDGEIDRELMTHLALEAEEQQRAGLSGGEARFAAERAFGGKALVREDVREVWHWMSLERLGQDLRYATRTLAKAPGFTLVVVLSLALGIGANTAIFSVLNALTLRSLPVARPHEVFAVRQQDRSAVSQRVSYPMFQRLREATPATAELAAMSRVSRLYGVINGGEQPETIAVQLVSGEYFSLLGVSPHLGRPLTPEDNVQMSGHPVAVVSQGFWERRLGASSQVLGQTIRIGATPFIVVGVAPRGFGGVWLESPTEVWIPLMMQSDVRYAQNYSANNADSDQPWIPQEGISWLNLIVRTQPDARLATTEALDRAYQTSRIREAESMGDAEERRLFLEQHLILESFSQGFSIFRQRFLSPLYVLMAMVGVVLLIACANTANLLLARAAARQREMAIRLSIGAGRGRLVRQLLTESFVLAGLAAALGLMIAQWAGDALVRFALGSSAQLSVGLDGRVLVFTTLVAIATALLFGLAPAVRATRTNLGTVLRATSKSIHGGGRFQTRKLLVASQVALSLLLIVGAGLFTRSFRALLTVDTGFEREHVLSITMDPRAAGYPVSELPTLYRRLVDRAETTPGVRSASVAMCAMVTGCRSFSDGIEITGYERRPGEQILIQENRVGPRYFSTVGISMIEGREFDEHDTESAPRVAIINEAFARRYFANRPAIGQMFGNDTRDRLIVGVAQDARVNSPREAAGPMAYHPLGQGAVFAGTLEVRSDGDPRLTATALRHAIGEVDRQLPIVRVSTVTERLTEDLNQERLVTALAMLFGMLALGLACFGLYGVMAYAVSRRTAELGIRIALGASPSGVGWMVFRESLILVVTGLALGVPAAFLAGRSLSGLLFGVSAHDPATVIAATLVLLTVAALAGYLPARQASRVDPLVALRFE